MRDFLKMAGIISVLMVCGKVMAGHEGGGGDVVILPDDTVVLADPWLNTNTKQPNNMPPLRSLNPRLLKTASLYKEIVSDVLEELSPRGESDIANELAKISTYQSKLNFYAVQSVQELNDFCASGGRKNYQLSEGLKVSQVACTAGNSTFLIEPLFLRLNLREQVLLLIHERLTTLTDRLGGKNFQAIAKFTTGLGKYIELYQKEAKKVYPLLTEQEQNVLSSFYTAIEEIQFRDQDPNQDSFQWYAHPNGGGRVHMTSDVARSSLVTLTSLAPKNSVIGENSKVIQTRLLPGFKMGNDTVIDKSFLKVKSSKSGKTPTIELGNGTSIIESTLIANGIDLIIGDNQSLKKNTLDSIYSELFYPVGTPQPKPYKLEWTQTYKEITEKDLGNFTLISKYFTSTVKDSKKSFFGKYSFNVDYKINVYSELNSDPSIYVVQDGSIQKAGFQKAVFIVNSTDESNRSLPYQGRFSYMWEEAKKKNQKFKYGDLTIKEKNYNVYVLDLTQE